MKNEVDGDGPEKPAIDSQMQTIDKRVLDDPYASPQSDSTTTLSSLQKLPNAWIWAVFAWGEFIGGLVVLGSSDYYVRWRNGWLGNGGSPTPDVIWFGVPLVLGGVAVLLLWRATANISRLWIRAVVVAAQSLLGFAAYLAACLWYVIETGVDSL